MEISHNGDIPQWRYPTMEISHNGDIPQWRYPTMEISHNGDIPHAAVLLVCLLIRLDAYTGEGDLDLCVLVNHVYM